MSSRDLNNSWQKINRRNWIDWKTMWEKPTIQKNTEGSRRARSCYGTGSKQTARKKASQQEVISFSEPLTIPESSKHRCWWEESLPVPKTLMTSWHQSHCSPIATLVLAPTTRTGNWHGQITNHKPQDECHIKTCQIFKGNWHWKRCLIPQTELTIMYNWQLSNLYM